MPVFGGKYPPGYGRCPNRYCRKGWIQQYKEISGRLQKIGKKKCTVCNGSGMVKKDLCRAGSCSAGPGYCSS